MKALVVYDSYSGNTKKSQHLGKRTLKAWEVIF